MKNIILLVFLLSGCAATQLRVTYTTLPSGAEIYTSGTDQGRSPVTLVYDISEKDRENGYVAVAPVTATWPSGATNTMKEKWFNIKESSSWNLNLSRPNNFPDSDKDYYFGEQHEQSLLMQRQIAQQQNEENAQLAAGISRAINRSFAPVVPESSTGRSCFGDVNCSQGQRCAKLNNAYQGQCVDVYYVNP